MRCGRNQRQRCRRGDAPRETASPQANRLGGAWNGRKSVSGWSVQDICHLRVEGKYEREYWLHLEMCGSAAPSTIGSPTPLAVGTWRLTRCRPCAARGPSSPAACSSPLLRRPVQYAASGRGVWIRRTDLRDMARRRRMRSVPPTMVSWSGMRCCAVDTGCTASPEWNPHSSTHRYAAEDFLSTGIGPSNPARSSVTEQFLADTDNLFGGRISPSTCRSSMPRKAVSRSRKRRLASRPVATGATPSTGCRGGNRRPSRREPVPERPSASSARYSTTAVRRPVRPALFDKRPTGVSPFCYARHP